MKIYVIKKIITVLVFREGGGGTNTDSLIEFATLDLSYKVHTLYGEIILNLLKLIIR